MTAPDLPALESEALSALDAAPDEAAVEQWRVGFLGRKGRLTAVLRGLRDLPDDERGAAGAAANQLKSNLEAALEARLDALRVAGAAVLAGDQIDVTLPARPLPHGQLHPITITRRRVERIFRDMGFNVVEGPDVEWDTYNFDRLRIPKDHPARDMWDTIWVDYEDPELDRRMLLRTHTSPMQIRHMETHEPPIRVIVPGTCYRYEATDATHEWMLTQVEGLVIDEGISFAHLKGTLESFVRRFFGQELETRFRCDYFPFVEPGAELAIRWKDQWLELLGSGMVHPEIIEAAGWDPNRYTGFAFGMGIERLAMLQWGIDDIRNFYQNDIRFLTQFRGAASQGAS
jgi:phenylalanyl-tRNA synthetase alpha chain